MNLLEFVAVSMSKIHSKYYAEWPSAPSPDTLTQETVNQALRKMGMQVQVYSVFIHAQNVPVLLRSEIRYYDLVSIWRCLPM